MLLAAAFRASVGAHQFGKGALPWTKQTREAGTVSKRMWKKVRMSLQPTSHRIKPLGKPKWDRWSNQKLESTTGGGLRCKSQL